MIPEDEEMDAMETGGSPLDQSPKSAQFQVDRRQMFVQQGRNVSAMSSSIRMRTQKVRKSIAKSTTPALGNPVFSFSPP
jgi:hypothetical protein